MSQITTHILDTTLGRPAAGVTIVLYEKSGPDWLEVARGVTNQDGRIPNLLNQELLLPLGVYRMNFDVQSYFEQLGVESFYPTVDIVFTIKTQEHYHVPLLLNPFGYSTYRGS